MNDAINKILELSKTYKISTSTLMTTYLDKYQKWEDQEIRTIIEKNETLYLNPTKMGTAKQHIVDVMERYLRINRGK
jgi:hypothetical protein